MKRRILMIGTDLNSRGGISRLQKTLLENWEENNYEIKHLTTHKDGGTFRKICVFFRSMILFLWMAISYRPHIAHIHFSINASIYRKLFFILVSKLLRIKVLLHSHTGEFDVYLSRMNKLSFNLLLRIINLADGLIILGSKDLDLYRKYYTKGKLRLLRNPIKSQSTCATLDSQQIVSVGSLGKRKGTYDLLKIAPIIYKEFPQVSFLLVGDGDVETIKNIIEEKSLENVRTTGWQTLEQVKKHLQESSIFVLPSYYEGMPMAILEAMAVGLPIISTNVNGIPDVVIHNENGILVEPGNLENLSNAIIKLLEDSSLKRQFGQSSKKRVESFFSPQSVIKELIEIYNELIEA